ncbi:hypothetical protein I542_4802 [Mycobacteroides abscessus 1948]|uniref:Uncharacterized protein n=1 Tax=Mycobacteroides abscessus 1948 TaxID=1299323 RepID=A0A829QQ26_9MYCO|nr:hypothetical protein I542_4802 [Mycobacteroides abscessus 1948]
MIDRHVTQTIHGAPLIPRFPTMSPTISSDQAGDVQLLGGRRRAPSTGRGS